MRLWLIAGAIGLACPWSGLGADPSGDPVQLAPVVVPLPAEEEPIPRRDPTGVTTVIDVSARAHEAKDAAELIASAPGIHLQQSGGVGQKETLILRGASSSGVLVFLDGIPLNGAGGIADLSLLPVAMLERLEVSRGHGSGGLGGAVNAVTRRIPHGIRLFSDLRYGSFATAVGSLGAAAPLLGGEALLLLHGTRSEGDYRFAFDPEPSNPDNAPTLRTRANNQAALGGGMFKLDHRLGAWSTSVLLDGLIYQRGLAGTARNPTAEAQESGARWLAAGRVTGEVAGALLNLRAHARTDGTRLSGGFYFTPLQQQFTTAGLTADTRWTVGSQQLVSAVLETHLDSLSVGAQPGPALGRIAASVGDEVLLLDGRLTLAPSLRLDLVHALAAPAGAPRVTHWLFSPKLGAAWSFGGGLELRTNLGQSHRAPSMLELYVAQGTLLPNANLRPERALHGDLTVGWTGEAARASLTGFYGLYQDLIAYEYYPPFLARPFNFDTAQVGGAELEAAAELPLGLRAEGAYTLTLSQNLRDDPRFYLRELPHRPRHRGQARLWAGPDWLRGRVEVDYRSTQFLNRTGTLQLPTRVLLNLGLTSRLLAAPALSVSLEARNLLDVHTEDFDGYPLPGRSFHLTLSATFEPK
ncbi:MAG: TonB-dependent receptor [Myxococcota bacterium]|nr:TonB-dependent receptor [Myxococcota bacterium]